MKIVENRILDSKISIFEKEMLIILKRLMNNYSFVDNQTYPRPSHPNINKRKDAYFTLVAILLSLRTTLENEIKAVDSFMQKYNSINDVLNSDVDKLEKIIKCAGMPKKKSVIIINVSKYIVDNYKSDINNINVGSIDEIRKKLLEIPNVGEKTADCMIELAFDKPSIVVDTNVFRVTSRLFFSNKKMDFTNKENVVEVKKFIEDKIEKDTHIYQIFHTIVLLHGKYVCKSKPHCDRCCINSLCKYYENNQQKQF